MENLIQNAIANATALSLVYTNGEGKTSQRTVTPLGIETAKNGDVTIRCETDRGYRSLRLDWIQLESVRVAA